jgi:3D (Asp-Asp-Asp) domain-containing protein
MTIQIVRSLEELEVVERAVPFETVMQPNENLELDNRQVAQAGQNGIEQLTYRIRYDNGVEAERTLDSSAVIQAPVNQIIHYGTKIVLRTIDTPEGTREYWRRLPNMYATSYHPEALGGDDVTAIGMTLRKGIIASNPNVIRYRTQVYVPGYGLGLMADTGGPRSTPYWIDLGYADENWVPWSKRIEVYLLTPVPERINYLLPPR